MSHRLASFLRDANEFIITCRTVIEVSIPHIYISALPCLRQTSMVAKVFKPMFPNTQAKGSWCRTTRTKDTFGSATTYRCCQLCPFLAKRLANSVGFFRWNDSNL